jgi:hypothetical protein
VCVCVRARALLGHRRVRARYMSVTCPLHVSCVRARVVGHLGRDAMLLLGRGLQVLGFEV